MRLPVVEVRQITPAYSPGVIFLGTSGAPEKLLSNHSRSLSPRLSRAG